MNMGKRGMELSLNLVVLIAIALIVLIVVVLIFSSGTTDFVKRMKGVTNEIWASKPNLAGGCQVMQGKTGACSIYATKEACQQHSDICIWQ